MAALGFAVFLFNVFFTVVNGLPGRSTRALGGAAGGTVGGTVGAVGAREEEWEESLFRWESLLFSPFDAVSSFRFRSFEGWMSSGCRVDVWMFRCRC